MCKTIYLNVTLSQTHGIKCQKFKTVQGTKTNIIFDWLYIFFNSLVWQLISTWLYHSITIIYLILLAFYERGKWIRLVTFKKKKFNPKRIYYNKYMATLVPYRALLLEVTINYCVVIKKKKKKKKKRDNIKTWFGDNTYILFFKRFYFFLFFIYFFYVNFFLWDENVFFN